MANWGNTGSSSGDYVGIGVPRGIYITINETGQIDSVWAKVFENLTSNTNDLKALVYDSSDNYLGASNTLDDGVTTTGGWYELVFSTPVAVTSGNVYRIYVWSTYTTDEMSVYRDSGNGYHDDNFPSWPTASDPVNPSLDGTTHLYAIYAEVSATGGLSIPVAMNQLRTQGIS